MLSDLLLIMHAFEASSPPPKRRTAITIWAVVVLATIGPALLAWVVRTVAFAYRCAPSTQPCHGIPLGAGLRDTLDLAWAVGFNTLPIVLAGIVAAIAALCAKRPLLGGMSAFALPLAALGLPTLAVYVSTYDGCAVNEAGVGSCLLWGAPMGMSFHNAAMAPWLLYEIMPYSVAAAVMLGLIGWAFCRRTAD